MEDCRHMLRAELSERQIIQDDYSQSDFARELELSPSALSRVLSGKRMVSQKLAEVVTSNIQGWTEFQKNLFVLYAKRDSSKTKELQEIAENEILLAKGQNQAIPSRAIEKVKYVTDITNFAVLEALTLNNTPLEKMAGYLGISQIALDVCMERLSRAGLIKKSHGRWLPTSGKAISNTPSKILRKTHTSSIHHTLKSLASSRHIMARSEVINIDPEQFEAARELYRKLIDRIMHMTTDNEKNDCVLHVNINLFKAPKIT
ncbi:MAG: DUF4423 domain-containing protein [Pseudobacteriovorax sp.]|nr:DUF4423 domain-containing protein [Pseudobacteriovorax sp.]